MYDTQQQQLYLSVLLSDPELYVKVKKITKQEYFSDVLKKTVRFIEEYNDEFSSLPDPLMISTKTGIELKLPDKVDHAMREWFLKEYPKFCLHKSMELVLEKGAVEVESQNYDALENLFKDAMAVRLATDYGLEYAANPKERLENIRLRNGNIESGFETLDKTVGLLNQGDLVIYTGGSGCVTADTPVTIIQLPNIDLDE